uniref:Pus10-like C-terminal domain-containing protein n=1 Tax=Glossina austeni TaxID=7395 RepID=A0A1A9VXT3_GLOAU
MQEWFCDSRQTKAMKMMYVENIRKLPLYCSSAHFMVMLLLLLYLLQRCCSGSIGSDLAASSSTTIRPFLERVQFCGMYCQSTTLRETFKDLQSFINSCDNIEGGTSECFERKNSYKGSLQNDVADVFNFNILPALYGWLGQAGTYIKELVHGEFGRTVPSIAALIGRPSILWRSMLWLSIWIGPIQSKIHHFLGLPFGAVDFPTVKYGVKFFESNDEFICSHISDSGDELLFLCQFQRCYCWRDEKLDRFKKSSRRVSGPTGYAKRNIMKGRLKPGFSLIIDHKMIEHILETCNALKDFKRFIKYALSIH